MTMTFGGNFMKGFDVTGATLSGTMALQERFEPLEQILGLLAQSDELVSVP